MWAKTLYNEISRRTGEDPKEVKRLLSLFFSGKGIFAFIKTGEKVHIRGLFKIYENERYHLKKPKILSERTKKANKLNQIRYSKERRRIYLMMWKRKDRRKKRKTRELQKKIK